MPHDSAPPPALTRTLAGWVAGLRPEEVPDGVQQHLRLLLLDCLGAGLQGQGLPWTQAVATWAERQRPAPGGGLASRWGSRHPALRPGDAALVNGVAAHGFELDDFHNAKLHPGAVVVPAVLALAEARSLAGPRLTSAIAAGYEVMIRLALALGPSEARLRGWHLTGICGSIGAAAASAHLLGLDAERTAWALGLGGTQSSGLFAFTADGSMSKRLHAGRAAQSGILAAELAELDFSGPTQLLEAEDGGWLRAFRSDAGAAELLRGLGSDWRAQETSFKPHACCGSLHAHVDAALELRRDWSPDRPVRVGLPQVVQVQCGYPYESGSVLNAQMSARYCVAVALLDGQALPAQFTAERIADPAVTRLAQRIELVVDEELDGLYPTHFCGWVEVAPHREGRPAERVFRKDPSGNPGQAGWSQRLREKFLALAGAHGTESAAQGVIEAVEGGAFPDPSALRTRLADLAAPAAPGGTP